jgi:hypothetical protein
VYRDLAIEAWPDDALANHVLTRGLLYEGFEREEPLFSSCGSARVLHPSG